MIESRRKYAISTLAFALMLVTMKILNSPIVLEFKWAAFKANMTSFIQDGIGGDGMKGIGIVIAGVGIIAAGISFVVHKFNPQSRMPGWITCLVVGLVGALLMNGIGTEKTGLLGVLMQARNQINGWFGIS